MSILEGLLLALVFGGMGVGCLCLPILIFKGLESSKPFKAKDAWDIHYENEILYFKTGELTDPINWSFKGSCTVWYWRSGKRCSTFLEVELYDIWSKTQE